jgi:sec-independent protein translocase protein TatC
MELSEANQEELTGQMSFLEHLDELRRRLVNSVIVIIIAFLLCWVVSDEIYDFLSVPIRQALSQAERRQLPVEGLTGNEMVLPLSSLRENETGKFVFDRATTLGGTVLSAGTSVQAIVGSDNQGRIGLFTNEPILTSAAVIPKGIKLPVELNSPNEREPTADERMIVTTATEPFMLYVTVSLYAAVAVSIPFLLFQVWGFISPALYRHERAYVTPFIALSSISFVVGAAFAYYILFPPAVKYLLGVGEDFRLLLRATDYFDFITLMMLAMGLVFQMPAISYVLSRIGIITSEFLIKNWKFALIIILIVAAIVSPTPDALNMMLFAAPMVILYGVSIFIAWFFGRKRQIEPEI